MRILILTNADIGLYKFRKELLETLCKNNKVIAAFPRGEFTEQIKETGCKYLPFEFDRRGMNPLSDFQQMRRYIKLLRKLKPDLVLTYTIKPNVYGGLACQLLRIPYITNVTGLGTSIQNGGVLSFLTISLYKLGLRKASCVFFQNRMNQRLFFEKRIIKGRSRVIPGSGVNLENYSYQTYPKGGEGFHFLFVGRVMKDKGIEELLAASRKIHKKRKDVITDIVGWSDEDYTEELKIAEEEGAIIFHGLQSDVRPFYATCHCAVLPSYHEGTANVMLEASSTGRPVITTRVPGCQETFDESVTGYGCEVKDMISLQNAMEKMLDLSSSDREMMGKAARKKMESEYDRRLVIDAYLEEIKRTKNGSV